MAVDPNVSRFLDLATNDPAFRAEITSRDKQRITDAFKAATGFSLTDQEIEAAANVLMAVGDFGSFSHLEEILSHLPVGIRGN
jgi:hypothetical protein